ncbi:MAG: hypothetical protein M1815_005028 [Lichina confinis]|nr:MAG: hypothetical protein M1815_005028 [Lichina confinis]
MVRWPHSPLTNDVAKWYELHEAMHRWTQIEMNLGIICANLPSLASLGRAISRRQKTPNAYSDPHGGNKARYELSGNSPPQQPRPRPDKNGATSSNQVVVISSRNTSEEQMVPKDSDIVRSINVEVNYERA